jgi:hypothetical protein
MKRPPQEEIKELIRSKNAIRAKYKKLKSDEEAKREYLKKSFQPITEPLNKLIKTNAAVENVAHLLNTTEKMNKDERIHYNAKYIDTNIAQDEKVNNETLHEINTPSMDPILERYISLHYDKENDKDLDRRYGIRSDGNRWMLGNSPITIQNDQIIINNEAYQGTRGLYELLFLKNPNEKAYNQKDLAVYKEMLIKTNAHMQNFASDKHVSSSRGNKYNNIIKELFKKRIGSGVNLNSVRYEYWDDGNELVERLRLLIASQQAGNNSVNNEIISIIEELREAEIIK